MIDNIDIVEELGITIAFETKGRVACECPFTSHEFDHVRPGFSVRIDDGRWICFKGCGQGSMVELVSRVRSIPTEEAERWLLIEGGNMDSSQLLSRLKPRTNDKPQTGNHDLFWNDYHFQEDDKTSQYILDRGFTIPTLKSWGFRYDSRVPAIVIPLFNMDGELYGLGRREVMEGAQPRKYMYSEGSMTDKMLFGAYKHNQESGRVVIVEGPLDCVWLHQCGITDAVALLGTYCSPFQKKLLAHLGTRIVLAMDADASGARAAKDLDAYLKDWFGVERVDLPSPYKDVQDMPPELIQEVFIGR